MSEREKNGRGKSTSCDKKCGFGKDHSGGQVLKEQAGIFLDKIEAFVNFWGGWS